MRAFQRIPVVDISGLYGSAVERRSAAATLGAAAREVGFLYIEGHKVPQAALSALRERARRYFEQPFERKMADYIGRSANHSGYVPEGEETTASGVVGKKESFDLGLDLPTPLAPMLGPNQWPQDPDFKRDVGAYYAHMADLSRTLFRGFALSLGLEEDAFEPSLVRPPSQLRLIHYPHDEGANDREGVGAHTDYECFTVLTSTAPGLEVMNDRGEWIDAPPVDGAFVINIGEMLEAWTNREFVATTHRVRAVREERYSFPFFAACDYWTVVQPLAAFVSAERPAAFAPIVAGEHLYAQTRATFAYLKGQRTDADTRFGRAISLA